MGKRGGQDVQSNRCLRSVINRRCTAGQSSHLVLEVQRAGLQQVYRLRRKALRVARVCGQFGLQAYSYFAHTCRAPQNATWQLTDYLSLRAHQTYEILDAPVLETRSS